MDLVKNETEVKSEIADIDKLEENPRLVENVVNDRTEKLEEEKNLIKELIDHISNSINEAHSISIKALELAQQFSVILEEKDSTGHHFSQISTPLKHAVESFGLSLKAIKFVGKTYFGISDIPIIALIEDTNLEDDLKEIPIKKESEIDVSDFIYADFDERDEDSNISSSPENLADGSGDYKCDKCDHTTSELRYLKQHMKTHMAGKFKCEHCEYTANKPYMMKSHINKVHDIDKVVYLCDRENIDVKHYLCHLCSYSNIDAKKLESHTQNKHVKNNEQDKDSSSEEEIMKEDGNVYKCTRCDYSARRKSYHEDHMTGGFKYLKCPWCDTHFKSNTKGKLGNHISMEHGIQKLNDKWICPDCSVESVRLRYLLHHLAKSHDIGTMLHCQQCSYSSFDRQNLINHSKDHNEASFPCPQCTHLAKSKLRLTKHIYDTHKKSERTNIKRPKPNVRPVCDICGASFSNTTSLSTHIKGMHTNERVQCEQCDYVTHNQINLYNHVKTRHSENKFFCDQCEYSTNTRPKFDYHVKSIHHKIRYFCDECDKDFVAETSLKRHKEVKHSNAAAKFGCTEGGCEYTTHSSYNLRMHVERVHKGIRWPCDLCDYVGGYKGDLTRHKKIAH